MNYNKQNCWLIKKKLVNLMDCLHQTQQKPDVLHGNLLTHVSGKLLCNVMSIPFVSLSLAN